MAKLYLLGVQEEVVQGLVISVSPPVKRCVLLAANGDKIAEALVPADDAEKWATDECTRAVKRVGSDEAARLGYDQPMELRIYK